VLQNNSHKYISIWLKDLSTPLPYKKKLESVCSALSPDAEGLLMACVMWGKWEWFMWRGQYWVNPGWPFSSLTSHVNGKASELLLYNNTHTQNTWPHTPHHGPHHILHPAETRLLLSGSSSLISRKGPVDEGWVSLEEGGYCVSTELSVSSPCNHDKFISAGLRLMLNSAVTLLLHQGFDSFW